MSTNNNRIKYTINNQARQAGIINLLNVNPLLTDNTKNGYPGKHR